MINSKIIVTAAILPVTISLFLSACRLVILEDSIEPPEPIDEPQKLEEHLDVLDNYLANRREIYQRQLIWDKEELDRKIKQLEDRLTSSERSGAASQINQLLQQQALVEQKIEVVLQSDPDNWEQAGLIADEELANLERRYDEIEKLQLGNKANSQESSSPNIIQQNSQLIIHAI